MSIAYVNSSRYVEYLMVRRRELEVKRNEIAREIEEINKAIEEFNLMRQRNELISSLVNVLGGGDDGIRKFKKLVNAIEKFAESDQNKQAERTLLKDIKYILSRKRKRDEDEDESGEKTGEETPIASSSNAPVQNENLPVQNGKAPDPNGKAPVLNDKAPDPNGKAPVLNDKAPDPNGKAPVLNDKLPVQNYNVKSPTCGKDVGAPAKKVKTIPTIVLKLATPPVAATTTPVKQVGNLPPPPPPPTGRKQLKQKQQPPVVTPKIGPGVSQLALHQESAARKGAKNATTSSGISTGFQELDKPRRIVGETPEQALKQIQEKQMTTMEKIENWKVSADIVKTEKIDKTTE